jgi:hypothetical protein
MVNEHLHVSANPHKMLIVTDEFRFALLGGMLPDEQISRMRITMYESTR